MPVAIKELNNGRLLEVHAAGQLSQADYRQFVPAVERRIKEKGRVNLLFAMDDFQGGDADGLWLNLNLDVQNFGDIERLAVVGGNKWEKWMSVFCQPFTRAAIRFFAPKNFQEARHWVETRNS